MEPIPITPNMATSLVSEVPDTDQADQSHEQKERLHVSSPRLISCYRSLLTRDWFIKPPATPALLRVAGDDGKTSAHFCQDDPSF
jgi:hypothetical protein